jgi:hypothetical protein
MKWLIFEKDSMSMKIKLTLNSQTHEKPCIHNQIADPHRFRCGPDPAFNIIRIRTGSNEPNQCGSGTLSDLSEF